MTRDYDYLLDVDMFSGKKTTTVCMFSRSSTLIF